MTFKKKEQEPQERSVIIPSTGVIDSEALSEQFHDQFEVIEPNKAHFDLREEERFMNEMLEVTLAESNNPFDQQEVVVGHQGVSQTFIRGLAQKVRRKFVYVLATAKTDLISTPEVKGRDGERTVKINSVAVPKHVFSITEDSKKGREWLNRVRAEPV